MYYTIVNCRTQHAWTTQCKGEAKFFLSVLGADYIVACDGVVLDYWNV